MYIDPADTPTHEAMPLAERHHLLILHDRHGWQAPEQLQDLRAAVYGATCQFADNKWNGTELRRDEEARRARAGYGANVPPRSRYQQASAAGHMGLRTASPNFPQTRLAAAQCRQPLCTLTRDQGFQSGVHDSSLLRDTAEPCRLLEQVIVNVQSRPHVYQYARFMHGFKSVRKVQATALFL